MRAREQQRAKLLAKAMFMKLTLEGALPVAHHPRTRLGGSDYTHSAKKKIKKIS